MSRFLVALVLLALLLSPAPARAQGDLHLAQVTVDVWPEYDQPLVLVIYHITLAPDTALPATLLVRIPAQAQINAVAELDPIKGLLNALYDRTVQDDLATLSITTHQLGVQVEYYDRLVKNDTERDIVYLWAGDYAVDALTVNFLEPVGAENLRIVPRPASSAPGQDGLTNHVIQAGSLRAGQAFTLTIAYQRQSNDLSISGLQVQAASTPGTDTPGHITMTGILPWLLGGLGVILIVSGVAGFLVWQRGNRFGSRRLRHTARQKASPRAEPREGEAVYCHQCGKRAQPGDVFCRTCGTRLHRE